MTEVFIGGKITSLSLSWSINLQNRIRLATSMKKTKTAVFFFLILEIVSSYDLNCPSAGHWTYRAEKDCAITEKYVCLLETIEKIKVEECTGPRKEADGFQTTINRGNFDNIKCFPERYQPLTFTTERNSECVFQKSLCSEEGQILHDPNDVSTESDRGCICNFIEGYAPINQKKNSCFCIPSDVTDCSCYRKTCASDEVLTQDYECVRKVQIGYDFKDTNCKKIIGRETTETKDDYKKEEVKGYEKITLKGSHTSASIAVCVITFLIMFTLLLWIFREWKGVKEKDKGFQENCESHMTGSNVERPTTHLNETSLNKSEKDTFRTSPASMIKPKKDISEKVFEERGSDTQTAIDNKTLKAEKMEEKHRDRSQEKGTQNGKISSEDVAHLNNNTFR